MASDFLFDCLGCRWFSGKFCCSMKILCSCLVTTDE
uniref:Uncharacterized protein n=1 Tax=Arundo donax TaxID=35708 RepID=A0A0A8YVD3_ARUDO